MIVCPHYNEEFGPGDVVVDPVIRQNIKNFIIISCPKCNKFLDSVT
jgi:hypothetical protein